MINADIKTNFMAEQTDKAKSPMNIDTSEEKPDLHNNRRENVI